MIVSSPAGADSGDASATAVTVVVVAYGDFDPACLAALDGTFPALVVDNSATPATEAVAAAHGARYIDAGANLGFAAGVNLALAHVDLATSDVLLLNPDATIDADAVRSLQRVLHASARAGAAAPAQHRPGSDRPPTAVCWPFPTPGGAWHEAVGLGRRGRPWEYVIASVLLVRGDALVDVGGFDEGFFLYAEEADWERRATRRGWEMLYCPDVTATHVGAATDPDARRRHVRFHAGVERYVRKWHGTAGWRSYQAATVLTALRRAALARGERRRSALALAKLYAGGPGAAARRAGAVPERAHHVPALAAVPGDRS
jgi:GT2 family glycosyltransferase